MSSHSYPFEAHVLVRPSAGAAYLLAPDGRKIFIPSGSDDAPPATPPAAGGDPPATPPAKLSWEQIDWDNAKIDARNFPKPIQEIFDRALAKDRREGELKHNETREQLKQTSERYGELKTQFDDLNAAVDELKNPTPPGDDPLAIPVNLKKHPDLAESWLAMRKAQLAAEEQTKAQNAELAALKKAREDDLKALQSANETRTLQEKKLLDLRRDRELVGVLATLKAFDPQRLLPLYRERTQYDADHDSFVYRTTDGELVPLATGLKTDLPDNFILPDVTHGGSGAHGAQGAPRSTPSTPANEHDKLAQEFDAIKAKQKEGKRLTEYEQTRLLTLGRKLKSSSQAAA